MTHTPCSEPLIASDLFTHYGIILLPITLGLTQLDQYKAKSTGKWIELVFWDNVKSTQNPNFWATA